MHQPKWIERQRFQKPAVMTGFLYFLLCRFSLLKAAQVLQIHLGRPHTDSYILLLSANKWSRGTELFEVKLRTVPQYCTQAIIPSQLLIWNFQTQTKGMLLCRASYCFPDFPISCMVFCITLHLALFSSLNTNM